MIPALVELTDAVLAATDAASRVGSGRIVGGWGYVWASYGLTAAAVVAYALSLVMRRPRAAPNLKDGQP